MAAPTAAAAAPTDAATAAAVCGVRGVCFSGLCQLMVMRWEVAAMAVAASVLCDGSGSAACWRRRIATAAVGEGGGDGSWRGWAGVAAAAGSALVG